MQRIHTSILPGFGRGEFPKNYIMQRYNYLLAAFCLLLTSYSFAQPSYTSVGNDIAEITLTIKDNGRFVLKIFDLAENQFSTLKGKWQVENENYLLTFSRLRKVDLNALFTGRQSQVINKRTVRFPANASTLSLWDISCTRK